MVPNLNLSFVQNTIEDLIYAFGKYWNLWNGQILQAFSWFKTNGWKDPLNFFFSVNLNKIFALFIYKKKILQNVYFKARPNDLSLVCLYLSLYISFLLFGHFFFYFYTLRQKVLLYKSIRKHTICMHWKFWDFSSFV